MKLTKIVSFLVIIFAFEIALSSTETTYSVKQLDLISKNYLECLKSDCDGVVEQAIFCVMILKYLNPDYNFLFLEQEIHRLTAEGNNYAIRHKAYIVDLYFQYPQLFRFPMQIDPEHQDDYFSCISSSLSNALIMYLELTNQKIVLQRIENQKE
jgi:hypothetical protein